MANLKKGMKQVLKVTTGVDIIEVERIKKAIEDLGDSFLENIYTEKEIQYCEKSPVMKYQRYATRFAAKEAVYKALSEFVNSREDIIWKNIEDVKTESGKTYINVDKLRQNMSKTVDNFTLESIDVSLSHVKELAVANTVVIWSERRRDGAF